MKKAALAAPLYISIAWCLIISYQLFTQTAVYSIVHFLTGSWPSADNFVITRLDSIVFIHAFAWIFVLSSVIPSIIIGKGRSILLQFFLCLTVAFVAVSAEDVLMFIMGANPASQIQSFSFWFQNPLIAGIYLCAPYILMLYLDIRSRKKARKEEQLQETESEQYSEEVILVEQEIVENVDIQEVDQQSRMSHPRYKEKMHFLFGASAACFFLGIITFLLGDIISSAFLTTTYRFGYFAIFLILGVILLGLGFYSADIQESPFS